MHHRRPISILVFFALLSLAIGQSRNCWTCPAGQIHWYDAGSGLSAAPGGDQCACVPSRGTTAAPTNNCWTCPSGYSHWWDLGLPQQTDPCACLPNSSGGSATTKAPAPTPASTPSCWTCPSGMLHWYELGLPQPADKCACYPISSGTTTGAPAPAGTTAAPARNCWTCPPGMLHWYELNLPEPTDKCACYPTSAGTTTSAPTKSQTTTSAPTPYCWTCPPGMSHWFELGLPQPSDKCACYYNNAQTTTTAPAPTPASTPSCWTCPSGMLHWYELNMPQPTDKCACYPISSGSVVTTTSAPGIAPSPQTTSAPITGTGDFAKWYSGNMGKFLKAMTPSGSNTGSVSFNPGVAPYAPWYAPPLSLISSLLDNLWFNTGFRTLMMYYVDSYTVPLVAARGFQMLGIISINVGADNSAMINEAIKMAKMYPDTIVGLACGNELGAQNGLTWQVVYTVGQCVNALRSAGVPQPIGSVDVYYSWCSHEEKECNVRWNAMSDMLDWLGLNDYPYWNNVFSGLWSCSPPETAAQATLDHHRKVMALYPDKPVVMTEFGWPGAPPGATIPNQPNVITGQQCGPANDYSQALMVQQTVDLYRKYQYPGNVFEAYKEAWKGANDHDINSNWGVCQGTPPYTCNNRPH